MKIFRKDISEMKTFTRHGQVFTQVCHNPETGWWLYDRGNSYEVVRGKKYRNPDGQVVYVYPSDEDWGTYGYTVMKSRYTDQLIEFYMSSKNHTPQEVYEFKKMLTSVSC